MINDSCRQHGPPLFIFLHYVRDTWEQGNGIRSRNERSQAIRGSFALTSRNYRSFTPCLSNFEWKRSQRFPDYVGHDWSIRLSRQRSRKMNRFEVFVITRRELSILSFSSSLFRRKGQLTKLPYTRVGSTATFLYLILSFSILNGTQPRST